MPLSTEPAKPRALPDADSGYRSVMACSYPPQPPKQQPKLRPPTATAGHVPIIDIRQKAVESSLRSDIVSMFCPESGPRKLPTMLLYDEKGLQLFEEVIRTPQITYLEEYYLTNNEIGLLHDCASEFTKTIPSGSMLVELGSGNLRKVNLLLQALDQAGKKVDYYALDLSRRELERTLAQLPPYEHVTCRGLLGTYDDGREWLASPAVRHRRKCILTLGSSIGNFSFDGVHVFLRSFAAILQQDDSILVGLDGCTDPSKVYHAYNDKHGVTHRFILNGLTHANRILGQQVFVPSEWRVIGEYVYDADGGGRHQAFYAPLRETAVLGHRIQPHERILVEQSLKWPQASAAALWRSAGLAEIHQWRNRSGEHALHLLSRPKMPFSLNPNVYAQSALPSANDWEAIWHAWDTVTRRMLPNEELSHKPIRLRNACIFYLGHIPTFLDIQLNKTIRGAVPTEPASYSNIFERGIDPDVDNPELCHDHSEIPDEWPPLDSILDYQRRVRQRVLALYGPGGIGSGTTPVPRPVAQAVWVGFEHELMHLETLLYMMLQSDKTLPPPDAPRPDFARLAARARAARVPNQWFDVPAQELRIGLDDPDDGTDPTRHFGWDNEKPSRLVQVNTFQAQGRPITNEEYALYMHNNRIAQLPASWTSISGNTIGMHNGSRTGRNANEHSSEHNGHATNGQTYGHMNGHTNGYANGRANGHSNSRTNAQSNGRTNGSSNGRTNGHTNGHANGGTNGHGHTANGNTKTAESDNLSAASLPSAFLADKAVRTVYGVIPLEFALDWPVFASYDELSSCAAWMGGRIPTMEEARSIYAYVAQQRQENSAAVNGIGNGEKHDHGGLFLNLDGANVGFQHWHPMPVTAAGNRLAGQAEMGGVWEWTSSVLQKHPGFEPMRLYPGYTADFFDGKHNVVLGGSWATHPRLAGRKSFVNWYQRNYPYAWVGARLVRDL